MSVHYSADLDLAASVVRELSAVEAALEDVIRDLRWRVLRLHVVFTGVAADAHLARHAAFAASYARMQSALGEMREALAVARANYLRAGSANAAMWESVR